MIRNLFGYIATLVMAAGGGAAYWYGNLSEADKAKADRAAADFARRLFNKAAGQLTAGEAKNVLEMARRHIVG